MNSKLAYNLDFLSGALGASCNKELQIVTKNHVDAHKYSSFDMDALHKHTLKWLDVDVKNEGMEEGVIFVRTDGSMKIEVVVRLSDTVESVKNKISEGLLLSQKSLNFAGCEMENWKSLMDYGVEHGSILMLQNKKSLLSEDTVVIFIKGLSSITYTLRVNLSDDVESLKTLIMDTWGIPVDQQWLTYAGRSLENEKKLAEFNIKSESTIHMMIRLRGGGCPMYTSDPKMFDLDHNLDFTNKKDDGRVFMRGGQVYKRPYGWNKVALNVKDNYDDTDWLGGTKGGQRMHEVEGEWPVSYHGTKAHSAHKIALEGFDGKKGKRFKYGRGIYSTPDPEKAEKYASVYDYQGKKYKVLIQNRVNMDDTAYIPSRDFFLTADEENIRPYGLLFKEIKD